MKYKITWGIPKKIPKGITRGRFFGFKKYPRRGLNIMW